MRAERELGTRCEHATRGMRTIRLRVRVRVRIRVRVRVRVQG